MATVPDCIADNSAGTAIQDYMTAFYNAWVAEPGDFTISNVVGAPVTSFTVTHTAGFQYNFRVSGGAILSLTAPDGGISNSASPGTPANYKPEDTIIPSPSGTSTRYQFAQYGDAYAFAINGSANTFTQYCAHEGVIRVVNNGADVTEGLGTLAYIVNSADAGTAFHWFSSNATAGNRKSSIRLGASLWASGVTLALTIANYSTQVAQRLVDLLVSAPDSGTPGAASPPRGVYKYLRIDTTTTAGAPLSVLPDSTSNQGWMRLNSSASTSRLVMLWNKLVTP